MAVSSVPLSGPVNINEATGGQFRFSTATLSDGTTVMVWETQIPGDSSTQPQRVMAQHFDANGNPIGDAVQLFENPAPSLSALFPVVTALDDGGYAVAFVQDTRAAINGRQIRVNTYDAEGHAESSTLVPNPTHEVQPGTTARTAHHSSGDLSLVALPGGGVAVNWSASYPAVAGQYASQTTNFVQLLGADGGLDGSARQITPWVPAVSYSQDFHDWSRGMVALAEGGFAVVLDGGRGTPGGSADSRDILVQLFAADGSPAGGPILVNTATGASQHGASIAALSGGGFVMTWQSAADQALHGQRFDAAGAAVGAEFIAMPASVGVGASTVCATPDGGFVVTTNVVGSGGSVYQLVALRFDADGLALGDPAVVLGRGAAPDGINSIYPSEPGLWRFGADGTGMLFFAAQTWDTAASWDLWLQRFAPETLGTAGNDLLQAPRQGGVLHGRAGNDTLMGGAGVDTLAGGAGNDLYVVSGADQVLEAAGEGRDTVRSRSSFTLGDNLEDLVLIGTGDSAGTGNAQANRITGNAGDNVLDGGGGADHLTGLGGNDTYVTDGRDVITEAARGGIDLVRSSVSYQLGAQLENLELTGTANLSGSGNALNNRLTGNAGNNVLNGGRGADVLTGGAGADVFVFDTRPAAGAVDRITDFSATDDTIRLDDAAFAALSVGRLARTAFVANVSGQAMDASDRIIYETDTGRLWYDADGSGAGGRQLVAVLTADLTLTAQDFVVI